MEHARRYFNEHYNEPISIEEFALSRSMSVSWFLRNFKQVNGMSPMHYILMNRINNATSLLETTDYNIAEISQSLGMRIPCISAACSKSRKESLPLTTESSCMTIPLRYRKQTSLPCCIVPQTKGQYHYKTQPLRDENYCLSLNGCSIFLWSCLPIQIFVYRLQM